MWYFHRTPERWSAYAPQFRELTDNIEYVETEDEFDKEDDAVLEARAKERAQRLLEEESVFVDIETVDDVFSDDDDDDDDNDNDDDVDDETPKTEHDEVIRVKDGSTELTIPIPPRRKRKCVKVQIDNCYFKTKDCFS